MDTEISSDLVDEARPSDLTDAQYRLLLESVPSGVIIAEAPSGRILRGNASLQRILRCTATCDDPQPVWFDLSGRELAATEFPLARALGDETVAAVVLQAQCGDGSMIWARVSAAPIHGPSGKVIFAVATIDDVGAEHQARALFEQKVAADTAALQHARARVRALFEHSPLDSLVLQVDEAGCVTVEECNEAFCLTSGYGSTDLAGRLIAEAMAPNTAEQIAAGARLCLQQGGFDRHYSFTHPLGERTVRTYYRPLPDESVSPLSSSEQPSVRRVLVTQIDLTESRRVEMALRESMRLEAIGQLTGGMAHEFNNLLTAVLGSLERLSREQTEERHLHWVQNAMAAARRGAVLTQQLLSYARKQFMAPAPTDVPAAIGGMTELIRGSLGGRISLDVDFAPDTWLVLTDSAQLELALLNLVINARQAMPQGGTLRLTSVNIPRGSLILPLDLQPGDYVCLSVSDTGTGMTPEVLGRAMEPFFTTKGIGGGSGLGLSQAYGVICQLGGTLRLNSTPGNGTKADLFLPRITDPAASVTRAPLPPGAGRAG